MALTRMRESICLDSNYYQDITASASKSIKESVQKHFSGKSKILESKVDENRLISLLRESNIEDSIVTKVVSKLKSDGVNITEHKIYRVPVARINPPGTVNGNHRRYTEELWRNVMNNQESAWKGLCGLADHPTDDTDPGSFKNSSIVWLGMEIEPSTNLVYGIGSFVGPYGHLAQEIIDCGGRVGFSSSGFGELMGDGETVNPSTYQIERLADVVLNPSQEVYGAINDEQRNIEYSGKKIASTRESMNSYNNNFKESTTMESGVNAALSKVQEKELRKHIKNYLKENLEITNPVQQLKDLREIQELIQEGQLADLESAVTDRLAEAQKKIEEMVELGLKMKESEVTVTAADGTTVSVTSDGCAADVTSTVADPVVTDVDTAIPEETADVPMDSDVAMEDPALLESRGLTKSEKKALRSYINNFLNESHENVNPLKTLTDLNEILSVVREGKIEDLEETVIAKLEETKANLEKDIEDARVMKETLGSKDLSEITNTSKKLMENGKLLADQVADYKVLAEALTKRNQELTKEYSSMKLKVELLESKEDESAVIKNQKIVSLTQKLEDLKEAYDKLDKAAGSKVVELQESLKKYQAGNAKLEKQNGILETRLREANNKINVLKDTIRESKSNVSANTKLEETIDMLTDKFEALAKENKALKERVANVDTPAVVKNERLEKDTPLTEAIDFREDGVESLWSDLHAKYGEAIEPFERYIRGAKTLREAQNEWYKVMSKIDTNLKNVRETMFYKNGAYDKDERLRILKESGMVTKEDVGTDTNAVNSRFLEKMNRFGLK